jgi:hypothetical protein
MLCEEGQRLKADLAGASARFSDLAEPDVKQLSTADRLRAEQLHVEQQDALHAFTQHVDLCPVCNQQRS